MPNQTSGRRDVTRILDGSQYLSRREVLEQLAPVVYDELRVLAAAQLRGQRPDHTLQPTALVNEAYLKLVGSHGAPWNDRGHFFRAAAQAMRQLLIEHARKRGRIKRGGGRVQVTLNDVMANTWDHPDQFLALDEAIGRLKEHEAQSAEVVHLRFFAGLSVQETAKALDLSERTVKRDWAFARAWLYADLGGNDD